MLIRDLRVHTYKPFHSTEASTYVYKSHSSSSIYPFPGNLPHWKEAQSVVVIISFLA